MASPTVTVIIPVYNGAEYLAEAIQSVLDQTYPHLELVVVDDASTDRSSQVVDQFADSRLIHIVHKHNQGSNEARLTGINASSGEIVAFLDQDDYFHPEKIETHVAYRTAHPEVDFTYSPRFELNYSSPTIREIWMPPKNIILEDILTGFPIIPSDMVLSRDLFLLEPLFDSRVGFHGGEIIMTCRPFLSGCRFGRVDRVLSYRRHHTGRVMGGLEARCESELRAQELIIEDPRFPADKKTLAERAYQNTYMVWAGYAFDQEETMLGQRYLRQAFRLDPKLVSGNPCPLVTHFVNSSVADENQDHSHILRRTFSQLPSEFAFLSACFDWAVARGYLIKGARAVIWGRLDDGRDHFVRAAEWDAKIDGAYQRELAYRLLNYELEYGYEATENLLGDLAPYLRSVGGRASARQLRGYLSVNRAFQSHQLGERAMTRRAVIQALTNSPGFFTNRGLWSILLRSSIGIIRGN